MRIWVEVRFLLILAVMRDTDQVKSQRMHHRMGGDSVSIQSVVHVPGLWGSWDEHDEVLKAGDPEHELGARMGARVLHSQYCRPLLTTGDARVNSTQWMLYEPVPIGRRPVLR